MGDVAESRAREGRGDFEGETDARGDFMADFGAPAGVEARGDESVDELLLLDTLNFDGVTFAGERTLELFFKVLGLVSARGEVGVEIDTRDGGFPPLSWFVMDSHAFCLRTCEIDDVMPQLRPLSTTGRQVRSETLTGQVGDFGRWGQGL